MNVLLHSDNFEEFYEILEGHNIDILKERPLLTV